MFAARLLLLLACLGLAHRAVAEVWETLNGQRIEAKLSGVYGPFVVLNQKDTTTPVAIEELTDTSLQRLADFLAQPRTASAWGDSGSKVAKALKGRLQVLRGEKLVDFQVGARREPQFYLVYFGANWCPPCRAFSPKLLTEYQRLQQLAPDTFEVLFVSSDHDGGEQLEYVRHVRMPWPVLRFSQVGTAAVIERWKGPGIPCLVVVTRDGDAILHSYHGTEYVGPYDVLQRFEALLASMDPNAPSLKRRLHRLAVMQHCRAAAARSQSAQPYAISLDLRRYQTLEFKEIEATLAIDERGRVTEATFKPELPSVLSYQMTEDASNWLFLPAVENGVPRACKAVVPLSIQR